MSISTDNWDEVQAASRAVLGKEISDLIDRFRQDPEPGSRLIAVLHEVQDEFGYLSEPHLNAVAQLLQVPAARVAGVASFYHYFRLKPRGQYVINVCLGTACYVKGADQVARRFKDELGIDFGETSTDGMFSLEASRCLGTCGLAPVIMINEKVHARVTPDQVPGIVETCIKNAQQEPKP